MKISVLLALLSASALVACNGGSGGGSGSGGNTVQQTGAPSDGSQGNSGGETPETTDPAGTSPAAKGIFNPFPQGYEPITEPADIYAGIASTFTTDVLKLDPQGRKFSYYEGDNLAFSGAFDPQTGQLVVEKCEAIASEYCEVGDTELLFEKSRSYFGGNFVRISDPTINAIEEELPFYFATTPTEDINLPNGQVVYDGQAVVYTEVYNSDLNRFDYQGDKGNAQTRVNFDAGTVDASFGGFTGDFAGTTAELTSAQVNGNNFSGGNLVISNPAEGEIYNSNQGGFKSYGGFFGENGEEVGGRLRLDDVGDQNLNLYGAWYGIQQ